MAVKTLKRVNSSESSELESDDHLACAALLPASEGNTSRAFSQASMSTSGTSLINIPFKMSLALKGGRTVWDGEGGGLIGTYKITDRLVNSENKKVSTHRGAFKVSDYHKSYPFLKQKTGAPSVFGQTERHIHEQASRRIGQYQNMRASIIARHSD